MDSQAYALLRMKDNGNLMSCNCAGNPLFTIVTVCWNEASNILRTVESVVRQEYADFEYLLIDGASKDNTVEIACQAVARQDFPAERFRCISEQDRGVYDAMNKGVGLARGRYIIFMNAGDSFYSPAALSQYAEAMQMHPAADVLYGSTLYVDGQWQKVFEPQPLEFIRQCTPFCHQATATRRDVLLQYPFRLQYRIVADYDFFLRSYLRGALFVQVPHTLARFVMGGLSNANVLRALHEVNRVARDNGIVSAGGFVWREFITNVRQCVRAVLPQAILRRRKERTVSLRGGWTPIASETYTR